MNRPIKPEGVEAPGLTWRPRQSQWVAYWQCRSDIARRGYEIKTRRIWPPSASDWVEPSPEQWDEIGAVCRGMQDEMLIWARGGDRADPRSLFDGTFGSLIGIYLNDADSPINNLRFKSQRYYSELLRTVRNAVGERRLATLSFRDFKRWHEKFRQPKVIGGPERVARAHALMTMVRLVLKFGILCKIDECVGLTEILSNMAFETPKKRVEFMTAAWADAIRAEAHRQGYHSIALAQAFQFELMLRQKDVIGEWLPIGEPGASDIIDHCRKWLHGIRWNEIDGDLILRHRISKSLRGRRATLLPDAGKVEAYDLKVYPMIREELALVSRGTGALITNEKSGLPWRTSGFQFRWREIARAAGVPDHVQNRDSRAGGVTEGRLSGASLEDLRHHASHSQLATTARYDRDNMETKSKVAELRSRRRTEQ